jgi:hypothetical protein
VAVGDRIALAEAAAAAAADDGDNEAPALGNEEPALGALLLV